MTKTNQNYDIIKETTIFGFNSIFKIVGIRKVLLSNWINIVPLVSAFLIVILCLLLKIDPYIVLIEIKDLMLNLLPGILGFTVAGYSFMIGLIHAGMINKITEPFNNESNFSLYQKSSATFAANIIIQAVSLVIAYSFHLFIFFDKNENLNINLKDTYITLINLFALLSISYLFTISLLMVIQVIINIFNFSQLHHYFVNKEKLENKSE
jgi:hypothetical protein